MITRLYVNNFRCLVAFEASFDSFGVLCGPNGAGKSSIFDAMRILRDLASADMTVEQAVSYNDQTNWLDSRLIEFEIDLKSAGHVFNYHLQIEQQYDNLPPRISKEQAFCDRKSIFNRDLEGVKFEKKSGVASGFPLDWRLAALGSIQPSNDRQEIKILQQALGKILILRPNPLAFEDESKEEKRRPDLYLSQLTSWYRHLHQEQEWSDHLRDSLQCVWPDFRYFRLVDTGLQAKALQLMFENSSFQKSGILFFGQLSDGEKMLVGLYMLQSAFATGAVQTLLIDEPDNFVGLPELQPWVTSLMELLGDEAQALLITHHPEILNSVGVDYGRYLWRDTHTSPTRIAKLLPVEGISVSETIARGWVNV